MIRVEPPGLAAFPFAGTGGGAGGGGGGASGAGLASGITGGSLSKMGDSSAGRSMSTGVGAGLGGPLFATFSGGLLRLGVVPAAMSFARSISNVSSTATSGMGGRSAVGGRGLSMITGGGAGGGASATNDSASPSSSMPASGSASIAASGSAGGGISMGASSDPGTGPFAATPVGPLLPLSERRRATSWASPGASASAFRYCRRAPERSPSPSSASPRYRSARMLSGTACRTVSSSWRAAARSPCSRRARPRVTRSVG
jgi:hypothetical protein